MLTVPPTLSASFRPSRSGEQKMLPVADFLRGGDGVVSVNVIGMLSFR
jgi:hypothetical protein